MVEQYVMQIKFNIKQIYFQMILLFYVYDLCFEFMLIDLILYNFQATGYTPLMMAVKDNKTPLIDRLVELGADPCARNNVSIQTLKKHITYKKFQPNSN